MGYLLQTADARYAKSTKGRQEAVSDLGYAEATRRRDAVPDTVVRYGLRVSQDGRYDKGNSSKKS